MESSNTFFHSCFHGGVSLFVVLDYSSNNRWRCPTVLLHPTRCATESHLAGDQTRISKDGNEGKVLPSKAHFCWLLKHVLFRFVVILLFFLNCLRSSILIRIRMTKWRQRRRSDKSMMRMKFSKTKTNVHNTTCTVHKESKNGIKEDRTIISILNSTNSTSFILPINFILDHKVAFVRARHSKPEQVVSRFPTPAVGLIHQVGMEWEAMDIQQQHPPSAHNGGGFYNVSITHSFYGWSGKIASLLTNCLHCNVHLRLFMLQ